MKAITLKKNGGVENFVLSEIEIPAPGKNEVLVQVKAISINPVDAFVRQYPQALTDYLRPEKNEDTFILGWDISGIVTKVGPGVTEFKEGDEVFGMINFVGHGKAYAEYVVASKDHIALKPQNISHEEAAAATLAALTAWQSLVTYGKVKKGDKVLIHAAAGGVGHYAVQIAKYFGAYVIGTASLPNRSFLLDLGADEFLDYTSEKFEDKVNDADLVLDSLYGDHILRSLNAVKRGGKLISLIAPVDGEVADKAKDKDIFVHRFVVQSNGKDMADIASLLNKKSIKSYVSAVFPLIDLPKAHLQIETRKTKGKVVVNV